MCPLIFKNPVFHEGRNVTVRRGVKWDVASKTSVPVVNEGLKLFFIVDIKTKVMRFADISPDDICLEHDPDCQTFLGLLAVMEKIYPGFQPWEIVTVVEFEI